MRYIIRGGLRQHRGDTHWLTMATRPRRSLDVRRCASAKVRGQGGNNEEVFRAALGGGHGRQKERQLSSCSSGIDKAQTKLKLLRDAEKNGVVLSAPAVECPSCGV